MSACFTFQSGEGEVVLSYATALVSKSAKLLDIVWGKLPDRPWWPGIVCKDPIKNCHVAYGIMGNITEVHVQFFDEPPRTAWVPFK
jgi:hypothetical protein